MDHPLVKIPRATTLNFVMISISIGILSSLGLLFPHLVYPDAELRSTFMPNDFVNLVVGLPVLLVPLWLARRDRLSGGLLLPGALFFVVYSFIPYVWALFPSITALPYALLVIFSGILIFQILKGLDWTALKGCLQGRVRERFAGSVLIILALLILGRNVGVLLGSSPIAKTELAVLAADFAIVPFWFGGGLSLWKRDGFVYGAGLGLLYQSSMLYLALVVLMVAQPFLTGKSFPAADILVIAGMGIICLVPFLMFVRGVERKELPTH
jgi:hypothetical protein